MCMKPQKTQRVKAILRKRIKLQALHCLISMYVTNLRVIETVVLAYRQICRSIEKNRNPRNKPTYMVNKFTTKELRIDNGERLCVSLHSCPTLRDPLDCSPPGSSVLGFLRQNTGMGYHALLHRIFLPQRLNPSLLHLLALQVDSSPAESPGKPLLKKWC